MRATALIGMAPDIDPSSYDHSEIERYGIGKGKKSKSRAEEKRGDERTCDCLGHNSVTCHHIGLFTHSISLSLSFLSNLLQFGS